MIKLYDNFVTNTESNELIEYYNSNIHNEIYEKNKTYTFKSVSVSEQRYSKFEISKKIKLTQSQLIRIQLINNSIKTNEYMHAHEAYWTYLVFLNDNFEGGELVIEDNIITPVKNQMIIFSGKLKHKVNNVINGNRYTLVSFTDKTPPILNTII